MAHITEQKLKEMEAEMDRFEEEISTAKADGQDIPQKFILGSKTYDDTQTRLKDVPGTMSAPPQPPRDLMPEDYFMRAPHPDEPLRPMPNMHQQHPQMRGPPPMRPPPSFVPHQIRNRGPPPGMPPPYPPRGPPPGPPPRHGPPMGMRHPSHSQMQGYQEQMKKREEQERRAATISSTAVLYSEPRIIRPPPSAEASKSKSVAEGIELNVPVPENVVPAMVIMPQKPTIRHDDGDEGSSDGKRKKKKFVRTAAGTVWEDPTLNDWDPSDFRMFCGDLGNEVTDELLTRTFGRYPSFMKAKVVRDKRTNKTRGYGFVSFRDPNDFVKAMREMNGKYVGNRPIKLRKSSWQDRGLETVRKKEKEKKRLGFK
ncbi:hypothetical protein CAPTEDRAFT_170084 [Capitella teleta]|uniref:RNA-binding protein 42 n=1 Tax=Capitella teleta TaxID=283909 RepID=R7VDF7_CAPTE|nr:hypothetical protein CAPTEDRAFT_170084 [Capitella teleta]|eukprot:ELU16602.1 hypothetical protein CAPTEDRAFT_170084 [Capitella teleta]